MAQWSAHEDEQLRKLVKEYGPKRWSVIASKLKTKGSKQCRRRWKNHLNADLKSGGWTPEEDRILLEGHRLYGNKWTEIAKMVGGRTDNAVKNRYAALCKRESKGCAPRGGGGAGRGGRSGRKPRASDSDVASDVDIEEDSDDNDDARHASSSSESREPSPVRGSGGRGHGAMDSAVANPTPPLTRRGARAASPPLARAAATATIEEDEAPASAGVRSSVLGRRRQLGGGSSPPLQPEPEAVWPAKRRVVLHTAGGPSAASGAAGVGRQLAHTPPTPLMQQVPQVPQPQEAPLGPYGQQQQHQQPRNSLERLGLGGRSGSAAGSAGRLTEPDFLSGEPPLPLQQQHHLDHHHCHLQEEEEQQQQQQAPAIPHISSDGREAADAVVSGQPKKLPLTINIPNAASAEPNAAQPPSASTTGYGIEIRVLKNILTPCEIQYARELNDMQLPLHINVDEDAGSGAGRNSGGSVLLGSALGGEPPLTTSRQAANNALAMLFSPGSVAGGAASEFTDVLKWFQTGFTPRGGGACGEDMTPRHMSRMGLTPCGLGGSGSRGGGGHCVEEAGLMGTGLTPKCLRDSGSPRNGPHSVSSAGGGGLTPQLPELSAARRLRRQVAVAAALSAAASELPTAQHHPQESSFGPPSMGAGESGGGGSNNAMAAALGFTSPGGLELHAGHRQLLTKLIQAAAAADASGEGGAGGACGSCGAVIGEPEVGRLRLAQPSLTAGGMVTPEPLPSRGSLTRNLSGASRGQAVAPDGDAAGAAGAAGVVVMPHFTQQELLLLLEVLNSEDLQVLPPPPPPTCQQ